MKAQVGVDANAAMGIVQRKGLNEMRHVEADVLWIQEQQARRLLPLRKVPGQDHPSDMATKNVPTAVIDQYVARWNLAVADGRALIAPKLCALVWPEENRHGLLAAPAVGVSLAGEVGWSKDTSESSSTKDNMAQKIVAQTIGSEKGNRDVGRERIRRQEDLYSRRSDVPAGHKMIAA